MLSRCLARVKCTVYALYAINRSSSFSDTALVHDVLTAKTPRCGAVTRLSRSRERLMKVSVDTGEQAAYISS